MPQYRTMGLPKLTGHTDKDIKNLRDLFYQQDEQLRYLFEHLGTDIASEIWGNDNQSVKIKIDEDGIIAEIRESLDGDLQTLSTKINIAAGKIKTTVSRVEDIERNYVSDETLSGILSEYVTDDDIDTVYLSLKTEIDQNTEAIGLRATKEYVAESLNGYVTEAELAAELKVSSEGVLSTVSKSYATTGAVNTAQNTANAAGAAAADAQNTANSAKNTADAVAANLSNNYYAKTTIDQKFDGITLKYTDSLGNETSFKLINGAIDITLLKNQVDAAATTATNFISIRSDGGIEVGNKSGGSWTGYRSQMLASEFNILDADGTVLSSFGATDIDLGINSESAMITMCGKTLQFYTHSPDEYSNIDVADSLGINAPSGVYISSHGLDSKLELRVDSVSNVSPGSIQLFAEDFTNSTVADFMVDKSGWIWLYGSAGVGVQSNLEVSGGLSVSGKTVINNGVECSSLATSSYIVVGGSLYANGNKIYMKYNGNDHLVSDIDTNNKWMSFNYTGYSSRTIAAAIFGNKMILASRNEITFYPYDGQGLDKVVIGAVTQSGANITCLRPYTNNSALLGASSWRWSKLWTNAIDTISAVTVSSDRRIKDNISYDTDDMIGIFDNVDPASFTVKELDDGKTHYGFIAQDIIAAAEKIGLDAYKLGLVSKIEIDPEVELPEDYGERTRLSVGYSELIPILWAVMKKLEKEISKPKGQDVA